MTIQCGDRLPLAGYTDQNDRTFEQTQKQADWCLKLAVDVLDKHIEDYLEKHKINYYYLGGSVILQKHVPVSLMLHWRTPFVQLLSTSGDVWPRAYCISYLGSLEI